MILSLIVIAASSIFIVAAKPNYSVSLIDVDSNVTTTNNFNISLGITRPSRGVLGISGFAQVIEDIDSDKATAAFQVLYSPNGISYSMTPFSYPPRIMTEAIRVMYKNYLLDTSKECCEDIFEVDDNFVSPIPKFYMKCKDCILKTDNYPSHMRMGYYKLLIFTQGEMEFVLMILLKLEKD